MYIPSIVALISWIFIYLFFYSFIYLFIFFGGGAV